VDSLGRAQRGLGIDFTLWPLIPEWRGFRITHARYKKEAWFILANTQLSIGTVKATGDTTSTDAALGFKTNLANRGDLLLDDTTMHHLNRIAAICDSLSKDNTGRIMAVAATTCLQTAATDTVKDWQAKHWNEFAWSLAGAFGTRLRQSEFASLVGRGAASWTTLGIPVFGTSGQVLFQVREDWIRGGLSRDTSAVSYGARLLIGRRTFNTFAELLGTRRDVASATKGHSWTGGFEFEAADQLWITTGFGSTYNTLVKGNRSILIANLRWTSGSQRAFR
jgi:hypothetical protein